MQSSIPFLAALVALLVGLAFGKAWERYRLQEVRWIDRRRARESPHYILGLNFLVANRLDRAIDELARAARLQPDALEIEMILGNLYREKGQTGRAIRSTRPAVAAEANNWSTPTSCCLRLDYSRRVRRPNPRSVQRVLRLNPSNYALVNLEKLHEEQHQWPEARDVRRR